MEIKVRNKGREVVCSGSAIVPHGDYLEFVIRTLRFRLSLEYHDNEGRSYLQSEYIPTDNPKDEYMEIKGYNFDKSLMNTLSQPMTLAQQDGRNLSLSLVISSINTRKDPNNQDVTIEDKLVWYTWYLDQPQGSQQ